MPAGSRRRLWMLAATALPLLWAGPRVQAQSGGPRTAEVEAARVGFLNRFKLGTWTPVRVQLKGGTERTTGTMELIVPDDSGVPTSVRQPFDVAPGETRSVPAYVRPGAIDTDFRIRLYDADGRRLRGETVATGGDQPFQALMPEDNVILSLGDPQGVEGIARLPGFSDANNPRTVRVEALKLEAPQADLPGRWYGYDSVAAVVIDGNSREALSALDTGRGEALKQWVERGGHLIISAGSGWQQVLDSSLRDLLPATPAGRVEIDDLRALESFAGSTAQIEAVDGRRVQVTRLEEVARRGGKVLSASSSVPLVVRGPYGFGRVTLLAVDVDQRPFATWVDRSLFWVKAIDLQRVGGDAILSTIQTGTGRFTQSNLNDLAGALRLNLEQFPGIRLIPFGWVAFFIFLYILLIGPGDYFFLKKVLRGRMELTWLTFPAIVLAVSVAAYWAAYMVKGTELRVNKVDAVDIDQKSGRMRGTSWSNIFSPQNRDYDVAVLPRDPAAPADPEGSAPAKAPTGVETMLSWFSSPEVGFGGMGGGGRLGLGGGGYSYEPDGSAERLQGVRVPIWSTRCLSARWFGVAPGPLVKADLQAFNVNQLNGTITNLLDVPLNDVMVAFNDQVYLMGTIDAGATVRVELDRAEERRLSGYLANQLARSNDRAALVRGIMFHGIGTQNVTTTMSNNPLSYLDLSGQLALDRPMLVANVDRPAALLQLDGGSVQPKVSQTTVVRVILDLAEPGAGAGSGATPAAE